MIDGCNSQSMRNEQCRFINKENYRKNNFEFILNKFEEKKTDFVRK